MQLVSFYTDLSHQEFCLNYIYSWLVWFLLPPDREIAGAIKNLLDAVALVTPHVRSQADRQALERQKREFVRHSKHFSTTLKTFFKENSWALCTLVSTGHLKDLIRYLQHCICVTTAAKLRCSWARTTWSTRPTWSSTSSTRRTLLESRSIATHASSYLFRSAQLSFRFLTVNYRSTWWVRFVWCKLINAFIGIYF